MKRLQLLLIILGVLIMAVSTAEATTFVTMKTNYGEIVLELYPDKAPITVKNFIDYVEKGFYNGTIFHRVISGFMIQGGGFTVDMVEKDNNAPIKNEAANGLRNSKGTIAMARTNVPDSATSQFFINAVDNYFLDYKNDTPQGIGYAVFGKVVKGMDVVEKIAKVSTTNVRGYADVPEKTVELIEAKVNFDSETTAGKTEGKTKTKKAPKSKPKAKAVKK